eukprot:gene4360-4673_t
MLFISLIVALFSVANALSKVQLTQFEENGKRHFVEKDTGRQIFFHGVNAIVKGFPYVPLTSEFDIDVSLVDKDHQYLADIGVNVYRLGAMWVGAEPKEGQFNQTYFDELKLITHQASKYGIYTLLDMHQDVISEKTCGEGVPDYAAIPKAQDFPAPIDDVFTDIATDGYPTRQDCAKHNWPQYYNTRSASSIFQNLYNNVTTPGSTLQYWSRFWETVAKEFKNEQSVIGYELINEPWAGDIFNEPKLLLPSVADRENLQPAYDYITDNIRKIDTESLIAFAAVTWDDPIAAGFSHAPGSDVNAATQSIFAYHFYEPPQYTVHHYFKTREADAARLQTASMLTEFERPTNDDDIENDLFVKAANVADEYLLSWMIWEYKTFCRETEASLSSNSQAAEFGSCKTGYGEHLFWNDNGEINPLASKKMARTYAQKVSGRTERMHFNPETRSFELVYLANTAIKEPTEIFASVKYQYPEGYDVTLLPKGKVFSKQVSENIVGVYANKALLADGEKVIVRITPKSATN